MSCVSKFCIFLGEERSINCVCQIQNDDFYHFVLFFCLCHADGIAGIFLPAILMKPSYKKLVFIYLPHLDYMPLFFVGIEIEC